MVFVKRKWKVVVNFQENILDLAYNIFKIKYFYEVEELEKLPYKGFQERTVDILLRNYLKLGSEATDYISVLNCFHRKAYTLQENEAEFDMVLEYFEVKQRHLKSKEVEDHDKLWVWIQNKEYYEE